MLFSIGDASGHLFSKSNNHYSVKKPLRRIVTIPQWCTKLVGSVSRMRHGGSVLRFGWHSVPSFVDSFHVECVLELGCGRPIKLFIINFGSNSYRVEKSYLDTRLALSASCHIKLTSESDWQSVEGSNADTMLLGQTDRQFNLLLVVNTNLQFNWSVQLNGAD